MLAVDMSKSKDVSGIQKTEQLSLLEQKIDSAMYYFRPHTERERELITQVIREDVLFMEKMKNVCNCIHGKYATMGPAFFKCDLGDKRPEKCAGCKHWGLRIDD